MKIMRPIMTSTWVPAREKSKTSHEAEAGAFVSKVFVETVGVLQALVAGDLDKAATATSQLILGGLKQLASYTGAARILAHDQDRHSSHGPIPMDGGHLVESAQADETPMLDRNQLRNPVSRQLRQTASHPVFIDLVTER